MVALLVLVDNMEGHTGLSRALQLRETMDGPELAEWLAPVKVRGCGGAGGGGGVGVGVGGVQVWVRSVVRAHAQVQVQFYGQVGGASRCLCSLFQSTAPLRWEWRRPHHRRPHYRLRRITASPFPPCCLSGTTARAGSPPSPPHTHPCRRSPSCCVTLCSRGPCPAARKRKPPCAW